MYDLLLKTHWLNTVHGIAQQLQYMKKFKKTYHRYYYKYAKYTTANMSTQKMSLSMN